MSKRLCRSRTVISVCLATVLAGFCLACGPSDPGSDEVRDALGGSRYVGPALADLPLEHECSFSDDFLPVIRCGEPSNERRLLRLDRDLAVRVAAEPTDDQLRAKALVRLAPGPKLRDEAGRAVTYLEEALQDDEEDPQRKARLLADLAGAYLLWAEETQSPIEVVAGLEAALEAEELVPGLDDAVFNRRLALVQLGVDQPEDVADEPLLYDLAVHLAEAARGPEEPGCLSVSDFGRRMDDWSRDPTEESLARIREEASCWMDAENRFVSDVLTAANSDPREVSEYWSQYREARKAAVRKENVEVAEARLRELDNEAVPVAIRLASAYPRAMIPFAHEDLDTTEELLWNLFRESDRCGYHGLAASSMRFLGLIAAMRGDFGAAINRDQLATDSANRSGSPYLVAVVREQAIYPLIRVGREEEAWSAFVESLRALEAGRSTERGRVLMGGVELTSLRAFERVMLHFLDSFVSEISKSSGSRAALWAYLQRTQVLQELGREEEAREAARQALEQFESDEESTAYATWTRAELNRLQAWLEERPMVRRELLATALTAFRNIDWDPRMLSAQLALSRVERELGNPNEAIAILDGAAADLEEKVATAGDWPAATALVSAARPLVDQHVGYLLEEGRAPVEVSNVIGAYLGLRTGREVHRVPPGERQMRWTAFVRSGEIVHVIEADGEIQLARAEIDRTELEELRQLLLNQLTHSAPEARIETTLRRLADSIILPVRDRLASAEALVIVADDVLSGIQFELLPLDSAGTRLVDRFVISYTTDHRELVPPSPSPESSRIFALGASGSSARFPPLVRAEEETGRVAALYGDSVVLTGSEATRREVLRILSSLSSSSTPPKPVNGLVMHVAAHFEANTRSPLISQFHLNDEGGNTNQLTLHELVDRLPSELDLLYLSACDTGRGLPPAAHGLQSLAQAFGAAPLRRTVATLWPLGDEIGSEIAVAFHEHLVSGQTVESALREAKLMHRREHPGEWASLVVYR